MKAHKKGHINEYIKYTQLCWIDSAKTFYHVLIISNIGISYCFNSDVHEQI